MTGYTDTAQRVQCCTFASHSPVVICMIIHNSIIRGAKTIEDELKWGNKSFFKGL